MSTVTSYRFQGGRAQQLLATPHKRLIVFQRLLALGGIPGCPHGIPLSSFLLKNRRAEELQICELVPAPQLPVNTGEELMSQRARGKATGLGGLPYAFNVGSL